MRTKEDLAIGNFPGHTRDDVADGTQRIVHLDAQTHAHVVRADAIGKRQRALKSGWRSGAAQSLKNFSRFAPREDRDRNFRQRRCRPRVEALGIGQRRGAGGQRISVPEPTVFRVAALEKIRRPPVALRPGLAARETIVCRIAVDEEAGHARLFRCMHFYGAVAASVSCDGQLSPEIHPARRQLRVVRWHAVVDVHGRRRHVARRRIRDEPWKQIRVPGVGIERRYRLGDAQCLLRRRHQIDRHVFWQRQIGAVLEYVNIETRFDQGVLDDIGNDRPAGRSRQVRLFGHGAMEFGDPRW